MSERCNEKFIHTRRAHLHLAKVTKCWSPSHICARGNMTCDGDIYAMGEDDEHTRADSG